MTTHAKLSASGSERWILCPGSIKAEEGLPEVISPYANEGILAHTLAEKLYYGKEYDDLNVTKDMVKYITSYVDYLKTYPETSKVYIEQKVDFSNIVPEGFGTADAIIVNNNTLHIVDLKYGMGVKVEAEKNTQLLLYAIGVLNTLDPKEIKDIKHIQLEIIQPRLDYRSVWTLTPSDIRYWEGYIHAKAQEALRDDAPRRPDTNACRWCKANATCYALYDFTDKALDDTNKDKIDDLTVKKVLHNSSLIKTFLLAVEKRVYDLLLSGEKVEGYKLVPGNKVRKFKPEAEKILVEILGEKAYNRYLIGIGELDKLVDEKTLESLVYISQNRPLLVKNSDKRVALNMDELSFDPV